MIGLQWRNLAIFIYESVGSIFICSGRHYVVGQRNVNILQHLQSDRQSGASSKLSLNLPIQFSLSNVKYLHQLTSYSTT